MANVSHVYGMSWCRCTTPFGKPVEPPLNSQKAMSSGWSRPGRSSPRACSSSASNAVRAIVPAGSRSSRRVLGDDQLRVAVARVVGEVLGRVEEADRGRYGAHAHRPQEQRRERGRVVEHHQHAVLAADAELGEQRAGGADPAVQLRVRDFLTGAADRHLVAVAGLEPPVDERPGVHHRAGTVSIRDGPSRTVRVFTSSTPLGVNRTSGRKSPEANNREYSGSWNG